MKKILSKNKKKAVTVSVLLGLWVAGSTFFDVGEEQKKSVTDFIINIIGGLF